MSEQERKGESLPLWAKLEPTGIGARVVRVARRVPGVALVERNLLTPIERRFVNELARHVDEVTGTRRLAADAPELKAAASNGAPPEAGPAELLASLMRTSLDQTPTLSSERMYALILQRLVPDEARILAALAEGSHYALLHIAAGGLRGPGQAVLENASNVGRASGVALPMRTPGYVTHMRALGLAEEGPEDPSLATEYDILLTESYVIDAKEEADRRGRPRVTRRTLRISKLGADLWAAAHPS
jgi:hypothetical protein